MFVGALKVALTFRKKIVPLFDDFGIAGLLQPLGNFVTPRSAIISCRLVIDEPVFRIARLDAGPGDVPSAAAAQRRGCGAPPTNLAMAIRKDLTIIPLIKQIVTMAGQRYMPGNAYLDHAEFNWWVDPDATQVVLRAAVPHFIIPLDCTNNIPLTKEVYQQVAQHQPQTIITQLYAQADAPFFGSGPRPSRSTFGTLTR